MNTLSKQLMKLSAMLMAMVLLVTSCKRAFDEPPNADPNIPVTHTIKQLQDLRTIANDKDTTIAGDVVISGVVIGDDKSGNIYKQVFIQDGTAGINIQLDASSYNATYPVGRRVFVKVKGLTLGTYGGMMQLGLGMNGTSPGRIPQSLIQNYLIAGSSGNVVMPVELNIKDVTHAYQNMLIKLKAVEVVRADLSKTYADPTQAASAVNINLEDCAGSTIVLRSSSFANFAGVNVAKGKGDLVGIFTFYNQDNQFVIRDTSDAAGMTGTRCDGGTPVTTIAAMRALYAGSDVSIPYGSAITGTVVSANTNEAAGNYRIAQADNAAGVLFYAAQGSPVYPVGTVLNIDASGGKLTNYQGEIELANVASTNVKTGSGGVITPRVATTQQIIDNKTKWSSTVVTVSNVTISAPVASGAGSNYTITDATGNLVAFVRTASGITLPQGTATSITGYVGVFKGSAPDTIAQLGIRSVADVVGGVTQQPTTDFKATYGFGSVVSGSGGTTDPTAPPTFTGLTFGSFKAVGLSATTSANPNAGGRFSFTDWPTGAANGSDVFTGGLDATKYYEVTITSTGTTKFNLDSINFTVQRSSTGVRQWAVRSSADNYASNLAASISPANAVLSVVTTNVFQVTDVTTTGQIGSKITLGYTNLATPVTFRFYGFNAEAITGTFSLNQVTFAGVTK
jgi:hypothetical protein